MKKTIAGKLKVFWKTRKQENREMNEVIVETKESNA